MLTDIEIANSVELSNITAVVNKLNINPDDLDTYGKYMAKLPLSYINEKKIKNSKLILVTSISPTKAGIGKTTVSIGLNDALRRLNKNSIAVLREPSLGPCFGMKGGACGGGYSQVLPMEKINLHFTGDFHAITTANNMIAAVIDNYFYQFPEKYTCIKNIVFKRCLDINDRSLRNIYTTNRYGNLINTGFNITPASEIMAIFCLATDMEDLRRRIDNIIIAEKIDGSFMYCKELEITGSIIALLSEAIKPNIVQSIEHNPVIIHGGPFANIAHGCNTIIATKTGMSVADYVVTEAGFGSDLGAEKFWNIKCRKAGIKPNVVVVVVTIPGLKNQGGCTNIYEEDTTALGIGIQNLSQHVRNLKVQGHKVIVTYNSYASDTETEENLLTKLCSKELEVDCIKNKCFCTGGDGAIDLAKKVIEEVNNFNNPQFTYELEDSIRTKIEKVVENIYHINKDNIIFTKKALKFIEQHEEQFKNYPICIAKTQYSFADDPKVLPVPTSETQFHIDEIQINNGAEFLVVIAGAMMRMPGLPKEPAAKRIDFIDGKITGLS